MPRNFKPSEKSGSPTEQAILSLRYLCRAATAVEARLKEQEEEVPLWVQAKIQEAGMNLGMAVAYLRQKQQEKEKK